MSGRGRHTRLCSSFRTTAFSLEELTQCCRPAVQVKPFAKRWVRSNKRERLLELVLLREASPRGALVNS